MLKGKSQTYEYDEDSGSDVALVALATIATLERSERMRILGAILMTETDRTGGFKIELQTDEYKYTITSVREKL